MLKLEKKLILKNASRYDQWTFRQGYNDGFRITGISATDKAYHVHNSHTLRYEELTFNKFRTICDVRNSHMNIATARKAKPLKNVSMSLIRNGSYDFKDWCSDVRACSNIGYKIAKPVAILRYQHDKDESEYSKVNSIPSLTFKLAKFATVMRKRGYSRDWDSKEEDTFFREHKGFMITNSSSYLKHYDECYYKPLIYELGNKSDGFIRDGFRLTNDKACMHYQEVMVCDNKAKDNFFFDNKAFRISNTRVYVRHAMPTFNRDWNLKSAITYDSFRIGINGRAISMIERTSYHWTRWATNTQRFKISRSIGIRTYNRWIDLWFPKDVDSERLSFKITSVKLITKHIRQSICRLRYFRKGVLTLSDLTLPHNSNKFIFRLIHLKQ